MYLFYLDLFHCRQDQLTTYYINHDDDIESPATRIMFVSNEQSEAKICLKKWKAIKDDLYNAEDTEQHLTYLLQGWKYNNFAAPGVHLGLAPIEFLGENIVVPPWDWTPGKVKTRVYTIGKKGVQNGTATEIYSGVQSATRP